MTETSKIIEEYRLNMFSEGDAFPFGPYVEYHLHLKEAEDILEAIEERGIHFRLQFLVFLSSKNRYFKEKEIHREWLAERFEEIKQEKQNIRSIPSDWLADRIKQTKSEKWGTSRVSGEWLTEWFEEILNEKQNIKNLSFSLMLFIVENSLKEKCAS